MKNKKFRAILLVMLMMVAGFSGAKVTKAYKVYTTETEAEAETFFIDARARDYDIETTECSWGELTKSLGKTVEVTDSKVSVGSTEQYVRVVVTKTFVDENGNTLNNAKKNLADLIELTVDSVWTKDSESTAEREVYYLTEGKGLLSVADAGDDFTFITGMRLNPEVLTYLTDTKSEDGKTVTTTFLLDGAKVTLKVEAEGIQVHNAEEAALDSWGKVPSMGFAAPVETTPENTENNNG